MSQELSHSISNLHRGVFMLRKIVIGLIWRFIDITTHDADTLAESFHRGVSLPQNGPKSRPIARVKPDALARQIWDGDAKQGWWRMWSKSKDINMREMEGEPPWGCRWFRRTEQQGQVVKTATFLRWDSEPPAAWGWVWACLQCGSIWTQIWTPAMLLEEWSKHKKTRNSNQVKPPVRPSTRADDHTNHCWNPCFHSSRLGDGRFLSVGNNEVDGGLELRKDYWWKRCTWSQLLKLGIGESVA